MQKTPSSRWGNDTHVTASTKHLAEPNTHKSAFDGPYVVDGDSAALFASKMSRGKNRLLSHSTRSGLNDPR